MKNSWWTTLVALWMLGCGSSGIDRPVEFAGSEPESGEQQQPFPGQPTRAEQRPLAVNPATWVQAPAHQTDFELLTDPGELPFFRLATNDETERLPLDHTHVAATLHGLVAEVELTQTYKNPHTEPIEAVYVFPLPENSAVNYMEMRIGKRKIVAKIDERERAHRTYQQAKRAGFTAALLEQERPNVFTQSVANIAPGESIDVTLRYVQDLSYDRGQYEFVFPMVVGPRFMPGTALGESSGSGTHPNTTAVPDASRISPPYMGEGERSGHDISIEVHADAGHPIQQFRAVTHEVAARKTADGSLHLTLAEAKSIPNRDFVLRYGTVTARPQAALYVSGNAASEGFFSLVLEPPALDVEDLVGRREIVFVVDVSGSMSGTPLSMCRSAMRAALERLRPFDTFNIITFAGHTTQAFPEPRPANRHNVAEALRVVSELSAGGGTVMANAIDAALAPPVERGRHRYVFFMTDGYVGNESEIIEKSRRFVENLQRQGARAKVFGFGVGSSPNRHLVSGLSSAGKGISVYATNREDPNRAVNQFFHYIDRAVLTDVRIDWNGLQARQVYPSEIPDLFASHPLILHGRFQGDPRRAVQVLARAGDTQLTIPVQVAPAVTRGEPSQALGALWARARVDNLEEALLDGSVSDAESQITQLGLDFNLVTRFTSFVAVDSSRRVGNGNPHQVVQPAEQPEGVDLQMAGGRTRITANSAIVQQGAVFQANKKASPEAPTPAPAGPPAPAANSGAAQASPTPEAEASEDYGYAYDDAPLSAGGFEESAEAAREADGMEPPSSVDLANEDSDQDYQVQSKRGCGCFIVGSGGSGGFALGLGLGLVTLGAWRRRRQRARATLSKGRGPHQHQPAPAQGR